MAPATVHLVRLSTHSHFPERLTNLAVTFKMRVALPKQIMPPSGTVRLGARWVIMVRATGRLVIRCEQLQFLGQILTSVVCLQMRQVLRRLTILPSGTALPGVLWVAMVLAMVRLTVRFAP